MHHLPCRICIAVVIGILPVHAFAQQSDKVLLIYNKAPYSTLDLTFVSYPEAVNVVRTIGPKHDLAKYPPITDGYLLPGVMAWKPVSTTGVNLTDYYHHQLNGVVEHFIHHKVFELLRERYPVSVARYYDDDRLHQAIAKITEVEQRRANVSISSVDSSLSADEFANKLVRAFPDSNWDRAMWLNYVERFNKERPYWLLNYQCFPWEISGRPAPWFRAMQTAHMVNHHIEALIEKDKAKFIKMLEHRFGTIHYILARNADPGDQELIRKLIEKVTDGSGVVAGRGLQETNQHLRNLGSPVRLEHWFGSRLEMAGRWKVDEDNLQTKKFIAVKTNKATEKSYIYIFQEAPTPHFKDYSPREGGSFLYRTAYQSILTPLLREVLAKTAVQEPCKLRTSGEILALMCCCPFRPEVYGVTITPLIKE